MKISRRAAIKSGSAWFLLPSTSCVPSRPGAAQHQAALTPGTAEPPPAPSPNAAPSPEAAPPPGFASNNAATSPDVSGAPSHQVPPTTPTRTCERLVAKVGRNHGHELLVSLNDVLDGSSHRYDLRGSGDHNHVVELTAAELSALGRGEVVRKQSERGGLNAHRHRVLVRCEPLVLPPEMISACEIVVAGKDDHDFVIPESHVRDGIERSYDIQGVAGHTHVLTVTATDFRRIAAGESVDLSSGPGLGHFHHVYIRYPVRTAPR